MKKFLVLLLISTSVFSQKLPLKGKIVDKETKEPVRYANISFLKKNIGTSSSEFGHYWLMIDKVLYSEKVHISCLNYKDTIIQAKELHSNVIQLEPKSFKLEEIVISKKINRKLVVKKIKKREVKTSLIGTVKVPWTVARYFEYKVEYDKTPFIQGIKVFLSRKEKRKSKFRVRLFLIDSISNLPKEDLLKESLIVCVEKREKNIELDLSKYDIEIPKSGFFVALERLNIPYNFYEDLFEYKDSISEKVTRVAPDFGAIVVFNEKRYIYSKGKWHSKDKDISYYKDKTIVPAISLTLSN